MGAHPRFLFLHSFAHALIKELTFTCGYGSSSLRERLYVDLSLNVPMAGVLVYTASGDADGTLGGLVAQGAPGRLPRLIAEALRRATWCSNDPVCMEKARDDPQTPAISLPATAVPWSRRPAVNMVTAFSIARPWWGASSDPTRIPGIIGPGPGLGQPAELSGGRRRTSSIGNARAVADTGAPHPLYQFIARAGLAGDHP